LGGSGLSFLISPEPLTHSPSAILAGVEPACSLTTESGGGSVEFVLQGRKINRGFGR